MIVDLGGELVDLNSMDSRGLSVLSLFCSRMQQGEYKNGYAEPPGWHQIKIFNFLLSRGADPLVRGSYGGTSLNAAVEQLATTFSISFTSEFFVTLMEAIAKARLAKDSEKFASREELYALNTEDDKGHTPLSRAMTCCIERRRAFHDALLECGFDIDLFPPGEMCPVTGEARLLGCDCFDDNDEENPDYSGFLSGGADALTGNASTQGDWEYECSRESGLGDDKPFGHFNPVALANLHLAPRHELLEPTKTRLSPVDGEITHGIAADNVGKNQAILGNPHLLTAPNSLSLDIYDGSAQNRSAVAESTFAASANHGGLPSFLEPPVFLDSEAFGAIGWNARLEPGVFWAPTQSSSTENRWLEYQQSSFQVNVPVTNGPALGGLWNNPSTANTMEELSDTNVWSGYMALDS